MLSRPILRGKLNLDPVFVYGNYAEAGLWVIFGAVSLIAGKSPARFALGITFILFGASDVVEAHTGAWYHPWWLFVWKAICVVALIVLGAVEIRHRRK